MMRSTAEVVSNGAGTLINYDPCYVWVPYRHDDAESVAREADRLGNDVPDGVVNFKGNVGGQNRDVRQRGILWAEIQRRTHDVEYRRENESGHISDAVVPVKVVSEGKAAVAAYLAAHDQPTDRIARVLDVGERTVSQYLSDFPKGER